MLAAIRPHDVDLALLFHVLGAMTLVGTLLVVAVALLLGWRTADTGEAATLTRFGLRTLPFGVLPAYILMRVGAQWTESQAGYPSNYSPTWLGIGYLTADIGALFVVVCLILAFVGLRRMREGGGAGAARAAGVLSVVLLVAYLVAVWAMAGKPS